MRWQHFTVAIVEDLDGRKIELLEIDHLVKHE